jgi:Fe2+ or Zn2+ uptake regulation protein
MGDDHAHFELAEDLSNHHHHHLVCSACGKVSDVTLSAETEQALDEALVRAADEAAFELRNHRLDLVGRCAGCTSTDQAG